MQIYNDDYFNKFGVRSECDENKVLDSAKLKAQKQFKKLVSVYFHSLVLSTPTVCKYFMLLIPESDVLINYTNYKIRSYSHITDKWEIDIDLDVSKMLNDFVTKKWFIEISENTNEGEFKKEISKQLNEFSFDTVAEKNKFVSLVEISEYLGEFDYKFDNEHPLILENELDYHQLVNFLQEKIDDLNKRIDKTRAQWKVEKLISDKKDTEIKLKRLIDSSNLENFTQYDIYPNDPVVRTVKETAYDSALGYAVSAIFNPEAVTETFELLCYPVIIGEIANNFRWFLNTTQDELLLHFSSYHSTITITKEEI